MEGVGGVWRDCNSEMALRGADLAHMRCGSVRGKDRARGALIAGGGLLFCALGRMPVGYQLFPPNHSVPKLNRDAAPCEEP